MPLTQHYDKVYPQNYRLEQEWGEEGEGGGGENYSRSVNMIIFFPRVLANNSIGYHTQVLHVHPPPPP